MQPQTRPPVRPVSAAIRRKRHALLGVGCALGLVLAPLAGSALVVAVTASPSPTVAVAARPSPAALSTPVPFELATSPVAPSPDPVHDPRRARAGR